MKRIGYLIFIVILMVGCTSNKSIDNNGLVKDAMNISSEVGDITIKIQGKNRMGILSLLKDKQLLNKDIATLIKIMNDEKLNTIYIEVDDINIKDNYEISLVNHFINKTNKNNQMYALFIRSKDNDLKKQSACYIDENTKMQCSIASKTDRNIFKYFKYILDTKKDTSNKVSFNL